MTDRDALEAERAIKAAFGATCTKATAATNPAPLIDPMPSD